MPFRVLALAVRSAISDSWIVGRLRPWKMQSWALLWVTLSFLLVLHPAVAINSAQNRPAEGTSSFLQDKRAAAQQAFDLAQRLRSEGTAASLKSALEKYRLSRELWHQVGD